MAESPRTHWTARATDISKLQAEVAQLSYTKANHKVRRRWAHGQHHTTRCYDFLQDNHLKDQELAGQPIRAIDIQTEVSASTVERQGDTDSLMFKQAPAAPHKIEVQFGHQPDQLTDNAAAAVTLNSQRAGQSRIDHVVLDGSDSRKLFAVRGMSGTAH